MGKFRIIDGRWIVKDIKNWLGGDLKGGIKY